MLRSVKQSDASPSSQIESILAYYATILKRVYYEDYPKREHDLEHLVGITQSFQDRASLLDSLALDPVELTAIDTDPEKSDEPPLTLSTFHSSKGLEFKVVFIIHALDGVIPSSFSVGEEDSIEEERRLLYVAVTLAAEQLYISYPTLQFRRYEGQYFTKPSRFLETISPSVLEICSLVEETPTELPSHQDAPQLPPASPEVPRNTP